MITREKIAEIIHGNGPFGGRGNEQFITMEEALECADDIIAAMLEAS